MKIDSNLAVLIGCLVAVSFFVGIGSSATSQAFVNFTITPFNESGNRTFGGHVENLEVDDLDEDSISWVWENSEDANFSYNLVFFDKVLVMSGAKEAYDAEGLEEDECYEIIIISIALDGAEGPVVSDIACTLEEEDDDDDDDDDRRVRDDEIPNFFSSEGDGETVKDIIINLSSESNSEKKGLSLLALVWMVLGFLSFLMLISIVVLVVR
jgi:hypothetical protein